MGEFFKPWRRKLGVVTLVMALAFVVGWLRSMIVMDMVVCQPSRETTYLLISIDQSLVWQKRFLNQPEPNTRFLRWSYIPAYSLENPSVKIDWKWRWHGFGVGDLEYNVPYVTRVLMCVIPYWFIMISLTLLSAYLLLTNPRQSTPTKITEPIPEKVA